MTRFSGFSDAAKLYAENYDVVQEVQQAYRNDVLALLAVVEADLRSLLKPLQFNSKDTGANNRYWWLGVGRRDESAHLWITITEPGEVDHKSIVFLGGVEDAKAVVGLVALTENASFGLTPVKDSNKWNLFSLTVEIDGVADAAKTIAERVAPVLRAMHEQTGRKR